MNQFFYISKPFIYLYFILCMPNGTADSFKRAAKPDEIGKQKKT